MRDGRVEFLTTKTITLYGGVHDIGMKNRLISDN